MAGTADVDMPCAPLEVVFAIELTIRMNSWLRELSSRTPELIKRLQADIPGIKFSVLPYGNYYGQHLNAMKWLQFTDNVPNICHFVRTLIHSREAEIPEFVLKKARTQLSWTPGSRRVLIMMGNHAPVDLCTGGDVEWKIESRALSKEGVTIYALQCWNSIELPLFFKTITSETGGKHLLLKTEAALFDALMALCYHETNRRTMLANYEKEARDNCIECRLLSDMDTIFARLRNNKTSIVTSSVVKKDVTPLKTHPEKRRKTPVKQLPTDFKMSSIKLKHEKGKTDIINRSRQTSEKRKASLDKFKKKNISLLRRENVPESNFSLRSLPWSPWTLAMVCGDDLSEKNKELWQKRPGKPGYRLKTLPPSKSSSVRVCGKPALFEVAAQARDTSKKRYVVFGATSSCSLGVRNWERRLLGDVSLQVNRVLNSGGHVYVRFCLLTSKSRLETSRINIRKYDYAWRKMRRSKKCSRDLVKGSFVISDSGL